MSAENTPATGSQSNLRIWYLSIAAIATELTHRFMRSNPTLNINFREESTRCIGGKFATKGDAAIFYEITPFSLA